MGNEAHPKRVLAISTTAIGDTLLGTPAMDALGRYCELDVLVHMRCAELVQGRKGIRRLFTYRNNPFLRAWLAIRMCTRFYDRVVVLHSNDDILRLLPRLRYAKAANTQGWDMPELRLVSLRVPEVAHFTLERLRLAAWCGAPAKPAPMSLELKQEQLALADGWLEQNGLAQGNRGLVLLCPGAARRYKRWPAESFGRVAAHLGEAGYGIVVVGSASEQGLYEEIARIHPAARPLMGLPLMQAAAVISRADLLITNDTGTLHLAQAVDTKTLAIFGPTPEKRYAPQNPGSRTLKVDLPCEPCLGVDCAKPVCMDALKVKTVLDAALDMLGQENKPGQSPGKIT